MVLGKIYFFYNILYQHIYIFAKRVKLYTLNFILLGIFGILKLKTLVMNKSP